MTPDQTAQLRADAETVKYAYENRCDLCEVKEAALRLAAFVRDDLPGLLPREDDGEPVTEEWLRSEGFVLRHFRWECGRLRITQYDTEFNAWLTFDSHLAGAFRVLNNVTRGQVRALLVALGGAG